MPSNKVVVTIKLRVKPKSRIDSLTKKWNILHPITKIVAMVFLAIVIFNLLNYKIYTAPPRSEDTYTPAPVIKERTLPPFKACENDFYHCTMVNNVSSTGNETELWSYIQANVENPCSDSTNYAISASMEITSIDGQPVNENSCYGDISLINAIDKSVIATSEDAYYYEASVTERYLESNLKYQVLVTTVRCGSIRIYNLNIEIWPVLF